MLFVSRIWLVAKIASSLLTHGSLPHGDVKRKMGLVEGLLLLDLFWSAIPVGLITFVELFFCTPAHLPVTATVVWEKVKLAALAVDLVAAGHIIYFEYFKLRTPLPAHKHGSHEHQPLLPHSSSVQSH